MVIGTSPSHLNQKVLTSDPRIDAAVGRVAIVPVPKILCPTIEVASKVKLPPRIPELINIGPLIAADPWNRDMLLKVLKLVIVCVVSVVTMSAGPVAVAAVTKAVVASCVVFVPAVAVGAVGVPVRAGLASGA